MSNQNQNPKKYLDHDGLKILVTKIKDLIDLNVADIAGSIASINSYLDFLKSTSTNESSLASINVNTRLHVVNINSDQSLHLSGSVKKGYDVHIIVKNTSNDIVTVSMPTSESNSILICEESYDIEPNKFLEINVISDGINSYYRVGEQS